MPEIRKPDSASGWAGLAGVALAARLAWVFVRDHLAGTGGTVPAPSSDVADDVEPEQPTPVPTLTGPPTPRQRQPHNPQPHKGVHVSKTPTHHQGRPGLLGSAHRPPQRVRGFWAPFDTAYAARTHAAARAGRWQLWGNDANEANPEQLAKRLGLAWHSTDPKRIDGFFASHEVKFHSIRALPKRTSDHQPLIAEVEVDGVRFTPATVNDDWATEGSNFSEVRHCDVILIQEGKRRNYHKLAGPEFVVRQSLVNLGRAGSVIIIRKDAPLRLGGFGWTFGVAAAGLLPRWLAWQRCATVPRG